MPPDAPLDTPPDIPPDIGSPPSGAGTPPSGGWPITGVIFDFHSTLVSGGDPHGWLVDAWQRLERPGVPADALDAAGLAAFLDRIWEHARPLDPANTRDLSPELHREVFDTTIVSAPGYDADLADALYAAMPGRWAAYDDAGATLDTLRTRGVRTAILSNVGFDLRPVLDRNGLAGRFDVLVMSYEVGVAKPRPEIFARTLGLLGVEAHEALMVGDSWHDDAAAAALGIRTLILPRTDGPVHGLDIVLRLVG